jgi:signal peptidase I
MPPENTPIPQPNSTSSAKAIAKEIVIFAVIAFGIVLPFRRYVAEPYIVDGASMDPTFHTGDYLIVDKISYELGTPKRNTVVIFKYPNNPAKSFIKRIIGLPGETVTVGENSVTIVNTENPNGFEIDQSYVTHPSAVSLTITLGPDEYFVMGDNRAESFDSRAWGPLNKKYISGIPVLQLWPLGNISILPGNDTK